MEGVARNNKKSASVVCFTCPSAIRADKGGGELHRTLRSRMPANLIRRSYSFSQGTGTTKGKNLEAASLS